MGAPLLALTADTGLLHLGAREYDPETGAFTRRDPSGLEGGENQYAYAGGDPVNYWDPDGNFVAAVVVGAAAGAAIGGAEGAVFGAADEVLDQAFDPGRTGFDCGAIRSAAGRGAAAGAAPERSREGQELRGTGFLVPARDGVPSRKREETGIAFSRLETGRGSSTPRAASAQTAASPSISPTPEDTM